MSEGARGGPTLAFWRWSLHWQILLFLVLGAGAGALTGTLAVGQPVAERVDFQLYAFAGRMFLNAMKMLIVPLIVSSLIVSVASMGEQAGFARMGAKTMAYYVTTSAIAIVVGVTVVNLLQPGAGALPVEGLADVGRSGLPADLQAKVGDKGISAFFQVFEMLVPPNVFDAATDNGKMLGLIVFSLVFGYYAARLHGERHTVMLAFWQGCYDVMLGITQLVLRVAPIGIGGLIASTVAEAWTSDELAGHLASVAWFFLTVILALSIHAFVVLPLLLVVLAGVSPLRHYQAMGPALLTAFSTSSSAATLPLTMRCVEERAGVSRRVASFTLPLGATVNMDGTALYECVVVIYIAQLVGFDLGLATQGMILFAALLTSIGVAGVPSSSLVAIVLIMEQAGMSAHLDKLGLVMVVDRFLDMARTTVNVLSDSVAAVVIARTEGETPLASPPEALEGL